LAAREHGLRLPHVGWNGLLPQKDSILLRDFQADSLFYYVHSYALEGCDPQFVVGTCEYGVTFTAVIETGNIFGTQFHPEKSQRAGLRLLGNFLEHA
jgi:glutamine amidotransferase